jgi:hypothetical protein
VEWLTLPRHHACFGSKRPLAPLAVHPEIGQIAFLSNIWGSFMEIIAHFSYNLSDHNFDYLVYESEA